MDVVVQDASTLLNLLKCGLLLHAIEALNLHVLTTDLVAAEIRSPREAFDDAVRRTWVEVRESTGVQLLSLDKEKRTAKGMSLPDVSVVVLARTEKCPLFSSDGAIRAYAQKHGVAVYGELWILDQLVTCSRLSPTEAADCLRKMIEHGARLPKQEVATRLSRWDEHGR
jgi:predicted nucleic acid-binding protein